MFKFNELKSIHLEITSRCQASCPMCPRGFHGGVENHNLVLNDWTYEDFTQIFTEELYSNLHTIYFCGNFGDPIMNKDLVKMCQHIKDHRPDISVRVHTNGGARSTKWWVDLYNSLPENHMVFFGIDGLEDTNHIYRIGVNYEILMNNAKAFIDAGGKAEWVFIKFKHNEHQAQLCEEKSKEMGFATFTMKNTTRFIGEDKYAVLDKDGNIEYYLEPPTTNEVVFMSKEQIKNYQFYVDNSEIDCYVLKNKEIYIDAAKHVFPCCFLSSTPYQYRPKQIPTDDHKLAVYNVHQRILEQYNSLVESLGGKDNLLATNRSVKEIIEDDRWQNVWDHYWNVDKLVTCVRVCGKTPTSKPKDQFVKRVRNND